MLTCSRQCLEKMNAILVLCRCSARSPVGAAAAVARAGDGTGGAWGAGALRWINWSPHDRLCDVDHEVWSLVSREKQRQRCALELEPSENFCSRAVQECLGSCPNKTSLVTGTPEPSDSSEPIDPSAPSSALMEKLCKQRALEAFGLHASRWSVDVRFPSGAAARAAALNALLQPGERFLAPEAPAVREESDPSPLSALGIDDEAGARAPSTPSPRHSLGLGGGGAGQYVGRAYPVNPRSGLVNYLELAKLASSFKPRVIVARAACSPRLLELSRFRSMCDHVGALLLADYAQEAGLVAADVIPGPFVHSDVVAAACHHTLRGPRCGLLFYRRDGRASVVRNKLERARMRLRVAPDNNVMAAAAVALREAQHGSFIQYQQQVVSNAKALADALSKLGHKVQTSGTDTHLVVLDLRGCGLTSHQAAVACDSCGIAVARGRLGLRLGSAALTSRGLQPSHFADAAHLLDCALQLAARALPVCKGNITMDKVLNSAPLKEDATRIKEEVVGFIERFPMPGFEN